ncbi:MAG: LapA family protein [Spirochaetes bacterium]|nr:LapA family protein [Spirochaetota bacterium]
MKPKTIAIIVGTILLTILIFQNTHSVVLNIFFWEPDFPLIVLIVIVLGIGFGLGFFAKNISAVAQKKGEDY